MPLRPEQLGNARQELSVPATPGTGRCCPPWTPAATCEVGPGKFSPAWSPQVSWRSPRPHYSLMTDRESKSLPPLLPKQPYGNGEAPGPDPGVTCARHTDAVGTEAAPACPREGQQLLQGPAGGWPRREQGRGEARGGGTQRHGLRAVAATGTVPSGRGCPAQPVPTVMPKGLPECLSGMEGLPRFGGDGKEQQMFRGPHERNQEPKMARAVIGAEAHSGA